MSRRLALVLAAAFVLLLGAAQAAPALPNPNTLTSSELVDGAGRFDGRAVAFSGEAIGQAQYRGNGAWLHLNDDAYMYRNVEEGARLGGYNSGMAVWLDPRLARQVPRFGDYHNEGSIVRVVGTFNAACAAHGGDMDIHASKLRVLTSGRRAIDPIKPWKVGLAAVLSALAAVAWAGHRRAEKQRSQGLFGGW